MAKKRFLGRSTKKTGSKPTLASSKLVTEVFNNPSHPLTSKLRARFGVDQGTGVKVLSGSKADFRVMINTLHAEKKQGPRAKVFDYTPGVTPINF